MFKSKLSKVIVALLRRIAGVTRSGANRLMRAMLRSLMAMGRRANLPVAGFVLPTVTMVLLVVILLTIAITLRSFDRANMARNVRVNQQVLAAATPAIDRAKAKIQYMLREDPQRPTATPSDAEMYRIMSSYDATNGDFYTFGDEKRLILKFPLTASANLVNADDPKGLLVNAQKQENEAINTAWRYPVDTNNDGEFDTFTLYGIFFRNPPISAIGDSIRARKPLDARTPPMSLGELIKPNCVQGTGTAASLVGDSGWYRVDGKFQKSFFVYTANVPITPTDITASALPADKYQAFTGTPSISVLEYQQDQSRIPLSNNAVVYEDDLDISPGPPLNLNGRIFTNSNLLVSGLNAARSIKLFQVSSKDSCFYDQENSKIVVAGNVVNGTATSSAKNAVEVHLFKKIGDPQPNVNSPQIDTTTQSVSVKNNSFQVLYNSDAYSKRLNVLVEGQNAAAATTDPVSVQLATKPPLNQRRSDALQSYFKDRLRKVPFADPESSGGLNVAAYASYLGGTGEALRPKDDWVFPTGTPTTPATTNGPTGLELVLTQPPANNPENITSADSEIDLGDRVVIGNNLPAQRWDGTKNQFVSSAQDVGTQWKDNGDRTRTPQVTKLADVGATDRGNGWGETPDPTNAFQDGFWEKAAAQKFVNPLDGTGGLRVITSAGVYDRTNSFLPPPKWIDAATGIWQTGGATNFYDDPATRDTEKYPVVWPDSMPMSPLGPGSEVYDNDPTSSGWKKWEVAAPGALADGTGLPNRVPNTIGESLTVGKYAKGDLRMRATAVYHYAIDGYDTKTLAAGTQPDQKIFACVSSYYDPSNASTARNISSLLDVSGEISRGTPQAIIGSNNGIAYPATSRPRPAQANLDVTTGLLTGGEPVLTAQANLVFPDGRFANGPLRTALQLEDTQRTLAQKAAIDSTNCALDILSGTTPTPGLIPPGAIQEVAFLNAREIKAIERDNPATIVNEAFTLSRPLTPANNAAPLTSNYNQPLEERQPLEIRATQLDIGKLRGQTIGTGEWLLPNSGIIYASRDDALPDRSDRTLDTTGTKISPTSSKRNSPSDFQLDPTRKPNGIVLTNGQYLFRGGTASVPATTPANVTSVIDVVKEKGLTLVSNLPVYIKGAFNPHGRTPAAVPGQPPPTFTKVEEFNTAVDDTWGNFYTRSDPNFNFACRAGDPRLPQCGGDYWRPANVLADAVTLLSQNYRFGFRNEGDFDLRNNAGAAAVLPRRQQGFFNNNFATNGLSSGAFSSNGNLVGTLGAVATALTDSTYLSANPPLPSSYFNNFVTPVQRRGKFPEYVMETCTKLPLSECTDADWYVNPLATTPPLRASDPAVGTTYTSPPTDPADAATATFQAGSTVDPPVAALQRFPRRVAFQRDPGSTPPNQLLTLSAPLPFGISGGNGGNIQAGVAAFRASGGENALWFAANSGGNVAYDDTNLPYLVNTSNQSAGRTDGSQVPLPKVNPSSTVFTPSSPALTVPTSGATSTYSYDGSQPLLMPVPQLLNVGAAVAGNAIGSGSGAQSTGWVSQAVDTTFNLIIAAGDTPSRALDLANGDFNGGLQNLPRFLEIWSIGNSLVIPNNIKGSFIQQNRSAFSTAPYLPILPDGFPVAPATDRLASLFDSSPIPPSVKLNLTKYNIQGTRIPYFTPPKRNWGFDVGLLSQPPDLFTQKFTTPSTKTQPAEYFREVGRDDLWVKTLMCGVLDDGTPDGKPATSSRPNKDCFPPA